MSFHRVLWDLSKPQLALVMAHGEIRLSLNDTSLIQSSLSLYRIGLFFFQAGQDINRYSVHGWTFQIFQWLYLFLCQIARVQNQHWLSLFLSCIPCNCSICMRRYHRPIPPLADSDRCILRPSENRHHLQQLHFWICPGRGAFFYHTTNCTRKHRWFLFSS